MGGNSIRIPDIVLPFSIPHLKQTFRGLRKAFAVLNQALEGLNQAFGVLNQAFGGFNRALWGLRQALVSLFCRTVPREPKCLGSFVEPLRS